MWLLKKTRSVCCEKNLTIKKHSNIVFYKRHPWIREDSCSSIGRSLLITCSDGNSENLYHLRATAGTKQFLETLLSTYKTPWETMLWMKIFVNILVTGNNSPPENCEYLPLAGWDLNIYRCEAGKNDYPMHIITERCPSLPIDIIAYAIILHVEKQ